MFFSVMLLALAMPFQMVADDDFVRGDVDLDGNVSIKDVTTLIDYLLSETWPEDNPTGPVDGDVVTYVMNGIEINMVYVEGGTFWMGASGTDTEANANEYPAHQVTLSPYYICNTEVTQQLWRAVMGSNPSVTGSTDNVLNPVNFVSWVECKNFINKINEITGLTFRFLTEAEWEFAARGGNKSKGYLYSGSNNIDDVAWYNGTSSGKFHPVATKSPNELGIYDMSGNVEEWCYDGYGSYSASPQTNPKVEGGTNKVLRGGYRNGSADKCRVSYRSYHAQSVQYNEGMGLRIAMSVQ